MKKLFFVLAYLIISTTYGQWLPMSAPNAQFFGIDFCDENNGFLLGWTELYKTTNGGSSWQSIIIPGGYMENPKDVLMINENIVWCSEYSNDFSVEGILSKSEDGGYHWETKLSTTDCQLRNIFFLNETFGWICTNENFYYSTIDGGDTWEISDEMPADFIKSIFFIDENTGWACGGNGFGYVGKTTDGGLSWETQLSTPLVEFYFLEIEFANDQKGFVGGYNRTLFSTDDGGESWEAIATSLNPGGLLGVPSDYEIRGIEFIDENLAWIAGGNC